MAFSKLPEFREQLSALALFLAPHTAIFNREIILSWPACLQTYPPSWAELLERLSKVERWKFDSQGDLAPLRGTELGTFMGKLERLEDYAGVETPDDLNLPSWAFFRVGQKKRHEISKLAPCVHSLCLKHKVGEVVDIGGGVGHLARILARYFGVPALSLDSNPELQQLGLQKLKHHPAPQDAKGVRFCCVHFEAKTALQMNFFDSQTASVGLHTCGDLAMEHLKAFDASESPFALNFACCYHLSASPYCWHSLRARKLIPFHLESVALNLAARGHNHATFKDYQLKEKVKQYRYTLHFFLRERWGMEDFVPVGSALPRLYRGPFEDYALAKIKVLKLNPLPSRECLRKYFTDKDRQKKIRTLFHWNLVRWKFGRALESLILLDRCLWACEQGHKVTLRRFFRPEVSPRNLGILLER